MSELSNVVYSVAGMSASCNRGSQLFADAGNGWLHSALRYH